MPRRSTRCSPRPTGASERIWDTRVNNHNSMFGRDGRLWLAAAVRGADNPAFCKAGSDHPSAKAFPLERSNRHIAVLDPKTKKYTFVDTCFGTHHLQFGYDANDTLWTSGGGPVVGWLNTKMFDETGDAAKSQGWTALVLDTNGNGKRDAYVEPDQPVDRGEGQAHQRRLLCGDAEPGGRLHLGIVPRRHERRGADCAWQQSAADRDRRGLQRAAARLRRPRRRHRQAGRGVGVAGERAHRQLRSAQVQGAARTVRRPPAITARRAGRSTSIRVPASRASARTAPSPATTRGSISTTRSAWATTCRCRPAT